VTARHLSHQADQPADDGGGWLGPRSTQRIDADLVRPSRIVRWLKYALPALALGMAAILLAWPNLTLKLGPLEGRIDLQDNRMRMLDVRYEGRDDSGRPFVLNAVSAVESQSLPREITLEQPRIELKMKRGYVLARADTGVYHEADRRLFVSGKVQINDPTGYEIRGASATVELREGLILADEPVVAQGPLGLVHANAAAVNEKGQHIFLYRGVRATLYPNPKGS
jgi:lipopolysaccharide export system protein LptC